MKNDTVIRVLLADDHPLILRGVRELLDERDDMVVIGAETTPEGAIASVERLEPDVLIQDLAMGGRLGGLDVIRHVHRNQPKTTIVVLSMHSSVATAWDAMEQGASGYVTKLGDFDELITAILVTVRGGRFIGSPLTEKELSDYGARVRHQGLQSMDALTRRELQVLSLVASGRTSNEIAEDLKISRRTVESHRASVSSKLGLRNQAELTRYALDRGLVDDERGLPSANAQ